MARSPPGRSVADRLFPRRLHAAGRDRSDRLPKQGGHHHDLLFRAAAETLLAITADPKHLGARIRAPPPCFMAGLGADHHHVHLLGCAGRWDIARWRRTGYAASPAVCQCRCTRLFRLFLAALVDAHAAGRLAGVLGRDRGPAPPRGLRRASRTAAAEELVRLRQSPSQGPKRCSPISPATPSRHVANGRPHSSADEGGVTFRYKDYRRDGLYRYTRNDARRRRVHQALPAPRPEGRFHRIRR